MKIVTFYENIINRILYDIIVLGQGNGPQLLGDGLARNKEMERNKLRKFEILNEMANYVNSYNGGLEYLVAYNMDSLEEILYDIQPITLIQMVQYGDFNIHDAYFRFNGYGNLESLSYYEYEQDILQNEYDIVSEYIELANYGDLLVSDYNALND